MTTRTYTIGGHHFEVSDGVVRCWRAEFYRVRPGEIAPIPCMRPCSTIPVEILSNLMRQIDQGPVNIAG